VNLDLRRRAGCSLLCVLIALGVTPAVKHDQADPGRYHQTFAAVRTEHGEQSHTEPREVDLSLALNTAYAVTGAGSTVVPQFRRARVGWPGRVSRSRMASPPLQPSS
jgi:hypothetical protein